MSGSDSMSRRQFVAGASGALLAGTVAKAAESAANQGSQLAVQGGEKAVKTAAARGQRWGEPERNNSTPCSSRTRSSTGRGRRPSCSPSASSKFCPVKYVQTCSSGTAALHIAVAAAGIGLGDEVITSPITDIGTVIGVLYQQAVPVFADLGAGTYNLDVADVERRITPKTKAIIAVHLTGNPCDLDALKALADRHKLVLIEDCAQAWGAQSRGRPIGTVGHIACFSLQNSKHITCGDGGVVGSSDERFGPLLQKFGDKGGDSSVRRRALDVFATNYRMSEPQAAVAAAQLRGWKRSPRSGPRLGNLLTEKIADSPASFPTRCIPRTAPSTGSTLPRPPRGLPLQPLGVRQSAGGRRGSRLGRLHQGAALRRAGLPEARLLRRPLAGQGDGPDHHGFLEAQMPRSRIHTRHGDPRDRPRAHVRGVHLGSRDGDPEGRPPLRGVSRPGSRAHVSRSKENSMSEPMANRREFLATVGVAGAASLVMGSGVATSAFAAEKQKLAIDGGTPVRKDPLGSSPYGPQFYDDVEKQELIEVLESKLPFRWRGEGSKVLQFEQAYAKHLGVKHALGVTSGTTALYTAMAALGIGPGDEVILPAWTWYADYDAIVLSGALPVFAEIDESFSIDPSDIEARITPRTKAIIACHLQGCPADLDPILEIARKHKIRVVEDCAQCAGGQYKGKYVGTIGDIGINSFQLSKTITSGEGGAVITNDPTIFERAIRFHDVGVIREPYSDALGGGMLAAFAACNFRMNEFTGAVLKGQLQKLETICTALRRNSRKVREGIANLPGIKMRKSADLEGDLGVTVFLDLGTPAHRDRFLRALRAEGVHGSGPGGSAILPADERIENKSTLHPDWPSFTSPQGKAIQYGGEICPKTIDILDRHGGVIMDPSFTDEDLKDIIKAIRKVYLGIGPAQPA